MCSVIMNEFISSILRKMKDEIKSPHLFVCECAESKLLQTLWNLTSRKKNYEQVVLSVLFSWAKFGTASLQHLASW